MLAAIPVHRFYGLKAPKVKKAHHELEQFLDEAEKSFVPVPGASHTVSVNPSTRSTPAPRVFVPFEDAECTEMRELYRAAISSEYPAGRFEATQVTLERFITMSNEADVRRAATLYIVHQVNLALEFVLPFDFLCNCEVSEDGGRFDICWRVKKITVLVLELKALGVLDSQEFRPCWVTTTGKRERATAIRKLIDDAEQSMTTAMTGNAEALTRQAAKYGRRGPLVVLFDLLTMIVLDFMPGAKPYDDVMNPVRCMLVDQGGWTFKAQLFKLVLWAMKSRRVLPSKWNEAQ